MYRLLGILFLLVAIAQSRVSANDGENYKALTSISLYWRLFNGEIPSDAVPGGLGLHIGQAYREGYLHPGTVYPDGVFRSEYYGMFELTENFHVLCSPVPWRFSWVDICATCAEQWDKLFPSLVAAGYEGLKIYYVGRAFYNNEIKIGKVTTSTGQLTIWDANGDTVFLDRFEILVYT